MKAVLCVAVAALLAMPTLGCMTITKGSKQTVTFVSLPPGARITMDAGGQTITTPGQLELTRDKAHIAVVDKEGYEPTTVTLHQVISTGILGNFGCFVLFPFCFAVDGLSGDAHELKPDPVNISLVPISTAGASAPPPVGSSPPGAVAGPSAPRP
jgi:hypothetical protein